MRGGVGLVVMNSPRVGICVDVAVSRAAELALGCHHRPVLSLLLLL